MPRLGEAKDPGTFAELKGQCSWNSETELGQDVVQDKAGVVHRGRATGPSQPRERQVNSSSLGLASNASPHHLACTLLCQVP